MIHFTSDLHFNHTRIIELCNRPYLGVAWMNQAMIERWNHAVAATDEVYVLGDFAFWYKDAQPLDEIFSMLNGVKRLVPGNHDEQNPKVMRLPWDRVLSRLEYVTYGEQRFALCHFPLETWWHMERGVIHLHGHCHGSLKRFQAHRFDVGVDVWNFLPVRADALIAMAAAQSFEPTDHHIK